MTELIRNKKWICASAALVCVEFFLFGRYGYHWTKMVRYILLSVFMTALGLIDSRERVVPNRILLCMLVLRGALLAAEMICFSAYAKEILLSAVGGMAIGLLIFLMAYFFSRKGIGMGDVKLAGVLGLYLGAALIWTDILLSLILAAVYSIVQLLRKKLKAKDSIPLVPFFSIGTILVLIIGF